MGRIVLFLLLVFSLPLYAMDAGEALPDPAQEARALALGDALRCMVCQGESINDSPADLAKDLRRLVREQIKAGETDAAVLAFLQQRYGDRVLLKPPVNAATGLLWIAPLLFLGAGLLVFRGLWRRKQG
jgi:cytochrome c-type biogenesis protein CcmH